MEATTKVWTLLDLTVRKVQETNSAISLHSEAKDKFDSTFRDLKDDIKDNYMKDKVENLDRHKIAAIIIVSILESEAVRCSGEVPKGQKFIGQYIVAASVGFTYMQSCLNSLLKEKEKSIDKYCFPTPMSCETPYFDVFCRNLYYADTNEKWGLNPLDIADRLFLLEYYTLIINDIDPSILNEY